LTGDAVTQWRSQPKFLGEPKNLEGMKCLILGEQQYIFGDTASQSEILLLFLKMLGGMAL